MSFTGRAEKTALDFTSGDVAEVVLVSVHWVPGDGGPYGLAVDPGRRGEPIPHVSWLARTDGLGTLAEFKVLRIPIGGEYPFAHEYPIRSLGTFGDYSYYELGPEPGE